MSRNLSLFGSLTTRHCGLDPQSSLLGMGSAGRWMPDRVRHDGVGGVGLVMVTGLMARLA
ncbi:MAG: hypothetical protein Q9M13_06490 [Mariprofundales bacterium]|nr:hypothetical protein [Mariprofundales bacterium]